MRIKRVIIFTFLSSFLLTTIFALEIQKNEPRIFISSSNDRFSYGISQNKDDQLTGSSDFLFILPNFFIDINENSITNRTYPGSRYDELIIKAGTTLRLSKKLPVDILFTPQAGFCLLGNFGMEAAQNFIHTIYQINKVKLEYEHFKKPFAPLINAQASFAYTLPFPQFVKLQLDFTSDNLIFYTTSQAVTFNATLGTKSTFKLFAGYKWNQLHVDSPTLKAYKKETTGFNYGFGLDAGLLKFDYITFPKTKNGNGTISLDFLNFKNHNWQQTDIHFLTGFSFLINTKFLETQVQTPSLNNFSIYLNNKYVTGFQKNCVNPSEYRYIRDYQILTMGIKYEQPLDFLRNWVTPYIELGTGIASFGITRLTNHLEAPALDSYEYKTKYFWQLEANIGLDIIPQGTLNFGNAVYGLTVFAGTIFMPEHEKATNQIKQDTYRTPDWQLNAFEFKFGFMLHMGLDF